MISNLIKYIKDTSNKNSIIKLWIHTIAIFICVSILFGVLTYAISSHQFRQHADHAYSVLIHQIGASFDMNISDAQTVLLKYIDDRKVERLAQAQNIEDISYSQDKIDIINQMKTYIQLNSFISDIHLYFPDHDYIVTTETLSFSPAIHTAIYKDYMPDFSQWHEYFYNRSSGDAFIMMKNGYLPHTGSSNELYFMLSNQDSDVSGVQAYFSIVGSNVSSLLSGISLEEGVSIALVLADGTVFVSSDYPVWNGILEETAFSQLELDGSDKMISTSGGSLFLTRSKHMNIYYALYAPNNSESYRSTILLVLCTVSVIITIAMAILLTTHFVLRNAAPLMALRDMIVTGDIEKNDSELSLIRDAVERSQQTVSHMTTTLEVKNRELQDTYLAMLLNSSGNKLPDKAALNELKLHNTHFGVIVFSTGDDQYTMTDEQNVFLIVLAEKAKAELAELGIDCRYLTSDNVFTLIFNGDLSMEDSWNNLAAGTVHKFTVSWENNFDEPLVAASSKLHTDYIGASDANHEAIVALRYAILYGSDPETEKNAHASLIHYHYPVAEDNRLSNLLLHGTTAELKLFLDDIWQENCSGEFSSALLRCLAHDMASTALRVYQNVESDIETEKRLALLLDRMQHVGRNECKSLLMEIFSLVNHAYMVSQENSQDQFCADVLAYIRENYANPVLSIDSVCEKFNRSRNYVYVAFKSSTGEGLLYHINMIRLAKAKELLLAPAATVEKTAKAVGLNSALTLTRIFKRYEGISPSRYIEENKRGQHSRDEKA